jgi:hypothetical protein
MGYDLHAVIADGEALRDAARDLPAARLASIGQGLSLMPMTDALFDSVADGSGVGALGFWRLPGGFEKALAAWSAGGPVLSVEVLQSHTAACGQAELLEAHLLAGDPASCGHERPTDAASTASRIRLDVMQRSPVPGEGGGVTVHVQPAHQFFIDRRSDQAGRLRSEGLHESGDDRCGLPGVDRREGESGRPAGIGPRRDRCRVRPGGRGRASRSAGAVPDT